MDEQEGEEILAEVEKELAAIETDDDVRAFLEKHIANRYTRSVYSRLYSSDRRWMGRSPKQALQNVLSLSTEDMPLL